MKISIIWNVADNQHIHCILHWLGRKRLNLHKGWAIQSVISICAKNTEHALSMRAMCNSSIHRVSVSTSHWLISYKNSKNTQIHELVLDFAPFNRAHSHNLPDHVTDQSALALPKIDVDPLEPNVWEQWYSWYQLHYHQFLGLLCGFLVVLCGLNLSASCQREQDTQYVGVKRVSDTDTECDVEV